jgi:hypothetical protein
MRARPTFLATVGALVGAVCALVAIARDKLRGEDCGCPGCVAELELDDDWSAP